ncbi:MAG: OPT/YSL family transporter [Planctomycetes bacterium]|nr:OPT/YSL family transporter [Planctomycetota bacterium]
MREFSFRAIVLGVLVGALLAAANAFVGLKVGMTISASIPAAVVSLLIMRKLVRGGTLLESNMVQTVGSAGESVAAGMIFTIPALFMMGTGVALMYGYPLQAALFESVSAGASVGLSVGITDVSMPALLKVTYIVQMWLGRLEFVAIFALLGFFVSWVRGK